MKFLSLGRTLAAVIVIAGVTLGAGCVAEPMRMSAVCGIAIDASGSGGREKGFNADQEIDRNVVRFLAGKKCKHVAYAAITKVSESGYCTQATADIDPDVSGGAVDWKAWQNKKREGAREDVKKLLACARKDPRSRGGSDVLGALKVLQKKRPDPKQPYHLLVISDFVNTGPEGSIGRVDLTTVEKRAAFIKSLEDQGRVPSLPAAEVTTAGFGLLYQGDGAKFADFEAFWRELLLNHAECTDLHAVGAA